jgi:hypothetical protein
MSLNRSGERWDSLKMLTPVFRTPQNVGRPTALVILSSRIGLLRFAKAASVNLVPSLVGNL